MPRSPSFSPSRVRLDQLVVERGLAATRTEAVRLILAGQVRVGAGVGAKAGQLVSRDAALALMALPRFVGRGGEKLAGALDAFRIAVDSRVCLDVGASTGGFTDCLLQRGARHVYAVDVGRGQLHAHLRADARVTALEAVNVRYLEPGRFREPPSLATIDVSFISLMKVLPAVAACLSAEGEIVALVKPQFEVGRHQVGKGGVVRDARLHRAALREVAVFAAASGLVPRGAVASVLRGPKGNREFFLHLGRSGAGISADALEAAISGAVGMGVGT